MNAVPVAVMDDDIPGDDQIAELQLASYVGHSLDPVRFVGS